jgi:flagellar biosynthesis/type III secretory pathway M-ring protein FliF/YscJ
MIPQIRAKEMVKQLETAQTTEADIQTNSKLERLNQLKQLATTDPDRVASIIKNWVGKP